MTLLREELVTAEIAAARHHIREVGANNHGPMVKKFLAEVGLPEGYAWCDAFESFEEHAVAGRRLPIESASVWQTHETARDLGWLVGPNMSRKLFPAAHGRDPRPCRGDLVLYDFNGDGRTDDHIGIVVARKVIAGGYRLTTVEGNTGDASAADGDGVYLRERDVSRAECSYVRIPECARAPKPVSKKPAASAGGSSKLKEAL
jgi:hypothetical protein